MTMETLLIVFKPYGIQSIAEIGLAGTITPMYGLSNLLRLTLNYP